MKHPTIKTTRIEDMPRHRHHGYPRLTNSAEEPSPRVRLSKSKSVSIDRWQHHARENQYDIAKTLAGAWAEAGAQNARDRRAYGAISNALAADDIRREMEATGKTYVGVIAERKNNEYIR